MAKERERRKAPPAMSKRRTTPMDEPVKRSDPHTCGVREKGSQRDAQAGEKAGGWRKHTRHRHKMMSQLPHRVAISSKESVSRNEVEKKSAPFAGCF